MTVNLSYPYSDGTLLVSGKNDSDWKRFPVGTSGDYYNWLGCFGGYFDYLDGGYSQIYFSFPYYPVWYKKLITELNSFYTNIQYHIEDEKDTVLYKRKSRNKFFKTRELESDIEVEFKTPLFYIEFKGAYSDFTKLHLQYFFHHILRMVSYIELFISPFDKEPKGSYLQYILDVNNSLDNRYRSLTEFDSTLEQLKFLDDVKFCNWGIHEDSFNWGTPQSGILSAVCEQAGYKRKYRNKIYINTNSRNFAYKYVGWNLKQDYKKFLPERITTENVKELLTEDRSSLFDYEEAQEIQRELNKITDYNLRFATYSVKSTLEKVNEND